MSGYNILLHFVVHVLTQRSSELVVPVLGWRVELSPSSAAVLGKLHSLFSFDHACARLWLEVTQINLSF